jgi:hypothetical protein
MAYEMKEMSGSLFVNSKKEKDTHPDRNGTALIGGVEYWVSGWIKETKSGDKWLSLAFKPKEQTPSKPQSQNHDTEEDNIPF